MPITNARAANERCQLAEDLVEDHVTRVVVGTPSKIVFEVKSQADAVLAQAKLNGHGYHTEIRDQFLHAVF